MVLVGGRSSNPIPTGNSMECCNSIELKDVYVVTNITFEDMFTVNLHELMSMKVVIKTLHDNFLLTLYILDIDFYFQPSCDGHHTLLRGWIFEPVE